MAPHKQPPSLLTLSINSVVKLFHTSSNNINLLAPGMKPVAYPSKREVRTVKKVFVEEILASLWDSVFNAIVDSFEPEKNHHVECLLYHIFVQENLRKLRYQYHCRHLIDFRKLKNLVELDLSLVPIAKVLPIGVKVGKYCTQLERITFESVIHLRMLYGCTKLRSATFLTLRTSSAEIIAAKDALEHFPLLENFSCTHIGDALGYVESTIPLNLRTARQDNCTVAQIKNIILFCPNLQSLTLCNNVCENSEGGLLYEILATSSLEIRELIISMKHYNNSLDNFLVEKGEHLRMLHVQWHCQIPIEVYQAIARTCKNLINLTLSNLSHCDASGNANALLVGEDSVLMNLRKLELSFLIPSSLSMVKSLGLRNVKLSRLSLDVTEGDDAFFLKVMDWVSMEDLVYLTVAIPQPMSERVLRSIYGRCPNLTYISFHCSFTPEAASYLKFLRKHVEENNFNLLFKENE